MTRSLPVLLFCTLILAYVGIAHASTITYASWEQWCPYGECEGEAAATQSILYGATATDDAGTNLCGSTVPAGSPIHFTFKQHEPEDISWFLIGGPFDSPYGEWATYPVGISPIYGMWLEYSGSGWNTQISSLTGNYNARSGNQGGHGYYNSGWYDANDTSALTVNRPIKHVSGIDGLPCGAPGTDGSVTCTPQAPTAFTATFNFGATYGIYAGNASTIFAQATSSPEYQAYLANVRYWNNLYPQWASPELSFFEWFQESFFQNAEAFQVPAQTISCPITVTPPTNRRPNDPTIDTSGGGTCTVGTNYTIAMTATDSEGDRVYFKVYWLYDVDQTSYERVPAVGTVPSGQLQVATHQYANSGSHAIAVVAVDAQGAVSNLSTIYRFSCNPAPPPPTATLTADSTHIHVGESTIVHGTYRAGAGDTLTGDNIDSPLGTGLGATVNPDAAKDVTFTPAVAGTYIFFARATTNYYPIWATYADPLTIIVDEARRCTASDTYTCEDNRTVIVKTSIDTACRTTITRTNCPQGSYCQAGSSTCVYPAPLDVTLRVTPSLVRAGDQTRVKWTVQNVASCDIVGSGTNPDHWTTTHSDPLGELSKRIFQQTIYTMTCIGLDGSHPAPATAVVNIIPIFQEQ